MHFFAAYKHVPAGLRIGPCSQKYKIKKLYSLPRTYLDSRSLDRPYSVENFRPRMYETSVSMSTAIRIRSASAAGPRARLQQVLNM